MERYEKYKDSGVEWIGEIPEEWAVISLRRLTISHNQGYYSTQSYTPVGTKLIRISDIDSNGNIDSSTAPCIELSEEELDSYILKKGDFIFPRTGSIGLFGFVEKNENAIFASYLIRFKFNIFSKYLLHYFKSSIFLTGLLSDLHGGVNQNIHADNIKEQRICLPPHTDQTNIANYLDQKTAQIDKLIAQKERLIELYEEEKKAIINQAVTKGINPDVKLKDSGVEWLSEIPEEWKVKRLRYLGHCQNGVSKGADYFGSGFPFVSYGDVYNNIALPLNIDGLAKSTKADQETYSVIRGDVFFTRTSETIEEIGFASTCLETIENAIFSGFLIRFRPFSDNLFEGFSKYYFRSQLHRLFFVKEMNLVTRASLSQELLKKLPVLLPPIPEQYKIAAYLDKRMKFINVKIEKTKKIIKLQKEYRAALISEVVTGKIKVTWESAS